MRKNADSEFFTSIISQICDYAVDNGLDPDDTLKSIAAYIVSLTEIASFREWGNDHE